MTIDEVELFSGGTMFEESENGTRAWIHPLHHKFFTFEEDGRFGERVVVLGMRKFEGVVTVLLDHKTEVLVEGCQLCLLETKDVGSDEG